MVFVIELFSVAILVMFTVVLLNLVFMNMFYGGSLPASVPNITRKLMKENSNAVYLCLIVCLLLVGSKSLTYFSLGLFVYMTYKQPYVWVAAAENAVLEAMSPVREEALDELVRDNYTITFGNLWKYIKYSIRSTVLEFLDSMEDTYDEILAFYGTINTRAKVRERLDKLWEIIRKLFDSPTLGRDTRYDNLTDEEVLKIEKAIKRNRDPREMFNRVRRLPIFLVYEEDTDLFGPILKEHILVVYNFFKTTIVALTAGVLYLIYTIFFFKIQFLKQLSVWFVIGMLYFWLMSGFNFFVKRYQYGKFTSQIQRFWKRTNTCFWLIEGFLILLFFYYFLNSSQEPLYMYDYSAINQEFLVSLQVIFVNIVLLSVVIYFMYFTMLRINSNSWNQLNLYLLLISVFVFFSFFLETYQFYYVISSFNERLWVFNEEENLWMVDVENPILRTKHQYLFVCLIAKYWHFLFIFLSWVFFLIKSFERRKVTYVLFGANLQNMVLLYVLNFACYIQWFKWLYRRFFDLPYTWFFTNIDNKFVFRLFFEVKLLLVNILNTNTDVYRFIHITYRSLNLWNVDSLAMWKFI